MTLTDGKFAQLDKIEQECFHGSWTSETLLTELNSPLNALVTEERGGIIAGFALGRIAADEGELFQIAVLPQFRRQGIAQRLLDRLHAEMKSRGAVCCFLEVRSRNTPARALYEKSGYEYISLRRGYYPDDDAAIYRISLL